MNKKLFGALCFAIACASAAAYSALNFNSPSSSVLLENIEALSQDEGSIYLPCYADSQSNCIINAHTASDQGVITIHGYRRVQA